MNFQLALTVLVRRGVEFIVVGDVVNVASRLEAVAYGDPRRLRLRFDHLNNKGHHLAETRAGRIDALGAIGKHMDVLYEDLATDAVTVEAFGVGFRCIALDRLIAQPFALVISVRGYVVDE